MNPAETINVKFGEDGIMNTSPHDMHVFKMHARHEASDILVFEKGPVMVRCNQDYGEDQPSLKSARVRKAGAYTINRDDLKHYKGAKVLLCSTILANFHKEIKEELGQNVRVIVPDSGPTAQRNPNGSIIVRQFLEYGCNEEVKKESPLRREQFVDDWVMDTIAFIKEKGDNVKDGFIANRVLEGTADECLARMKVHGWKFMPALVYDPMTTHIHLVPESYNDSE